MSKPSFINRKKEKKTRNGTAQLHYDVKTLISVAAANKLKKHALKPFLKVHRHPTKNELEGRGQGKTKAERTLTELETGNTLCCKGT
jgi:hypothetical protein